MTRRSNQNREVQIELQQNQPMPQTHFQVNDPPVLLSQQNQNLQQNNAYDDFPQNVDYGNAIPMQAKPSNILP